MERAEKEGFRAIVDRIGALIYLIATVLSMMSRMLCFEKVCHVSLSHLSQNNRSHTPPFREREARCESDPGIQPVGLKRESS